MPGHEESKRLVLWLMTLGITFPEDAFANPLQDVCNGLNPKIKIIVPKTSWRGSEYAGEHLAEKAKCKFNEAYKDIFGYQMLLELKVLYKEEDRYWSKEEEQEMTALLLGEMLKEGKV